jgi:hypothetical protein
MITDATTHPLAPMTEIELALQLSILYRELLDKIGDFYLDNELYKEYGGLSSEQTQQAIQIIADTVDAACALRESL